MRVIGIDPGYGLIGYGVLDVSESGMNYEYLASGVVRTTVGLGFYDRLIEIEEDMKVLIDNYKPDVAVVEKLFFAGNKTTAMKVAEARGVIGLVLRRYGIEVKEVTPSQMKAALTGNGRASKTDVKRMVEMRLGLGKNDLQAIDDAIDGIAMGMCWGV